MTSKKQAYFRRLEVSDEGSPHFLAALQLIAHIVTPVRKGMVHFYLQNRSDSELEMEEWMLMRELGHLFQAMIAAPPKVSDDDDDDEATPAVDTAEFYKALAPCLTKFKKTTPKDATSAVQILLETIQACTQTLPVTGGLWSSMLDSAALGFVAKQSIVGKAKLEDGDMLQRTKKESLILACPYVIPQVGAPKEATSINEILKEWFAKQSHQYDFDTKPFDFEVNIPMFTTKPDPSKTDSKDDDDWKTTRTLQFTALHGFLILGLSRLNEDGGVIETEIEFPKKLDLSKLCSSDVKGSKEYELCGGILYDDEDYVAVLKNAAIDDPEEEGAWQLMETEEIIPMEESDIFEFMKGEGEEGPCGTLAVYKRCHESTHQKMNDVLSDIIISHASGKLNAQSDFYYEEVVED